MLDQKVLPLYKLCVQIMKALSRLLAFKCLIDLLRVKHPLVRVIIGSKCVNSWSLLQVLLHVTGSNRLILANSWLLIRYSMA